MEASHHPSVHISAFATNQEILLTLGTECDFLDDDDDDINFTKRNQTLVLTKGKGERGIEL